MKAVIRQDIPQMLKDGSDSQTLNRCTIVEQSSFEVHV